MTQHTEAQHTGSAANDVEVSERSQTIHVDTQYMGKYRSQINIRDLAPWYLDEPKELGGENQGPTPLEAVLSALCACTSMIIYIVRREMDFRLDDVRCSASGVIDVRRVEMRRTGKKFTEVEPTSYHYNSVEMDVTIKTDEPDERLAELRDHVRKQCPVSRLLEAARVPLKVNWVRA